MKYKIVGIFLLLFLVGCGQDPVAESHRWGLDMDAEDRFSPYLQGYNVVLYPDGYAYVNARMKQLGTECHKVDEELRTNSEGIVFNISTDSARRSRCEGTSLRYKGGRDFSVREQFNWTEQYGEDYPKTLTVNSQTYELEWEENNASVDE